ncbi:hypothetical protein [Streptomyces xinghaiensis]|uniref:hypothetical protein n=1 Tax=Streptomyces xinghaiensis TaxID=1038928 RepID=UPI0034150EA8
MHVLDLLLTITGAPAPAVAAGSALIHRLPLSGSLLALPTGILFGPQARGVVDLPTVVEGHKTPHESSRPPLPPVLLGASVLLRLDGIATVFTGDPAALHRRAARRGPGATE